MTDQSRPDRFTPWEWNQTPVGRGRSHGPLDLRFAAGCVAVACLVIMAAVLVTPRLPGGPGEIEITGP